MTAGSSGRASVVARGLSRPLPERKRARRPFTRKGFAAASFSGSRQSRSLRATWAPRTFPGWTVSTDDQVSRFKMPGASAAPADEATGPGLRRANGVRSARRKKKTGGQVSLTARRNGSPGMTRTCDPVINSHLLCQLSYWGMAGAGI